MEKKSLKWSERLRSNEQVYLKNVTAKQLAEINVGAWLEGFGDVNSLAVQKFIRKYGDLLFKLKDDPEYDGTDFAHPAFFRGSLYSLWQATRLVVDVLSGKDTGEGAMNEPAGSLRNLVLDLKRMHDRGWNKVVILEKENKRLIEELEFAKGN